MALNTFVGGDLELTTSVGELTVELRDHQWREQINAEFRRPDRVLLDMAVTPRPALVQGWLEGRLGRQWGRLGELFAVPPDTGFTGHAPGGSSRLHRHRSLSCLLPRALFDDLDPGGAIWSEALYPRCLDLVSPLVRAALRRMLDELLEPGFAMPAVLQGLAATLAVDLVRSLRAGASCAAPRGGLPAWRQRVLDERLRAESLPPPGIDELARQVGLSSRQLMRAFRQQHGVSLGQHVRSLTIERSRRMLAAQRLSVKEIASALGFSSPASFSHAFRRATGVRPGDYQRTCRALRGSASIHEFPGKTQGLSTLEAVRFQGAARSGGSFRSATPEVE